MNPNNNYATLAINDLAEECYASPAIAGDTLYFRTVSSLFAFSPPE